METPPGSPKSEAPHVSMPPAMFAKMAHCFYGDGPRYWQSTEVEQVEEPRIIKRDGFGHQGKQPPPHTRQHAQGLGSGVVVPAIPKDWKLRTVQEGDTLSDNDAVPTT